MKQKNVAPVVAHKEIQILAVACEWHLHRNFTELKPLCCLITMDEIKIHSPVTRYLP